MKIHGCSWKEVFPDWENITEGEWSAEYYKIQVNNITSMEFGLYHEPQENEEYKGTYTLQVFVNDDVPICLTCK